MSLSRKLVEELVKKEIEDEKDLFTDIDIEKLKELANHAFLIEVNQPDSQSVKSSLKDKIEHFSSLMEGLESNL